MKRAIHILWPSFLAAGVAVLMVSGYRYPHFVNQSLRGKRPFRMLVTAVLFLALVFVLLPGLVLVLAFWLYAAVSCIRGLLNLSPPTPTAPPVRAVRRSSTAAVAAW